MEKGGDDRIGIHPQLYQDDSSAHWMNNIRLPGAAQGALMGALCQLIGPFDPLHIVLLVGLLNPLCQPLIKLVHHAPPLCCNNR